MKQKEEINDKPLNQIKETAVTRFFYANQSSINRNQ
jgi:hypothetical protein